MATETSDVSTTLEIEIYRFLVKTAAKEIGKNVTRCHCRTGYVKSYGRCLSPVKLCPLNAESNYIGWFWTMRYGNSHIWNTMVVEVVLLLFFRVLLHAHKGPNERTM